MRASNCASKPGQARTERSMNSATNDRFTSNQRVRVNTAGREGRIG